MRILEDAGINRLYHHLNNPKEVAVFISVDRNEDSPAQNNRKRSDFKKIMRLYRFGYFSIKGGYIEDSPDGGIEVEDEVSFAVFAPIEKEDELLFLMLELSRLTKQDSIMFVKNSRAYWIYCSKQSLDKLISENGIFEQMQALGKVFPLGRFSVTDVDKYFSKIRGRKFSFSTSQVEAVEPERFERSWERKFVYELQEHLRTRHVEQDLKNLLGMD